MDGALLRQGAFFVLGCGASRCVSDGLRLELEFGLGGGVDTVNNEQIPFRTVMEDGARFLEQSGRYKGLGCGCAGYAFF